MVASQPLDSEDVTATEGLCRPRNGRARACQQRAFGVEVVVARPAAGAGHRLGVEAPVQGITILVGTISAERVGRHGGVGAIVGQRRNDRVAGPTVGAVDEGVEVARVLRIEELSQAVRADGEVGGDQGRDVLRAFTLANGETARLDAIAPLELLDALYSGSGWGLVSNGACKGCQGVL